MARTEESRKLDRFAVDFIEQMGETFDLDFDRDGPINSSQWWTCWNNVCSEVESYLNAVRDPVQSEKGEPRTDG